MWNIRSVRWYAVATPTGSSLRKKSNFENKSTVFWLDSSLTSFYILLLQLLAPHLRYTLEINCRGRTQLISANGIFKQVCHSETGHLIHTATLLIFDVLYERNSKQTHLQCWTAWWWLIDGTHDCHVFRLCLQVVMAWWFWLRGSTPHWPTAPSSPAMTLLTEKFPSSQTISTENTAWCCGRSYTGTQHTPCSH